MDELTKLEELASAATAGPWRWVISGPRRSVALQTVGRGILKVMDVTRWGMQGAQLRFAKRHAQDVGGVMRKVEELLDPRDLAHPQYIFDIPNPDARYIAAMSPDVALSLIQRLRTAEASLESAKEQGRREAEVVEAAKLFMQGVSRAEYETEEEYLGAADAAFDRLSIAVDQLDRAGSDGKEGA